MGTRPGDGRTLGLLLGEEVVRGYGDFANEYRALTESAGVIHRTDLIGGRMWGRDPKRMLNGLITNDLGALSETGAVYGAMLTPKGRIITDLVAFSRDDDGLGLVLPAAALEAVTEHLRKYVPPMFARWDLGTEQRILGLYGPGSGAVLAEVFGTAPDPGRDRVTRPDQYPGVILIGSAVSPGFEILLPAAEADEIQERIVDATLRAGGLEVGFDALETLRVERGIPRLGAEITEETLPGEVYLPTSQMDRAISFTKGCYTGQEVVVRIAHRGHVNRRIQGLDLERAGRVQAGDSLYSEGQEKVMGKVTSIVESPRHGRIALGHVRREIEVGDEVRVGSPEGPPAAVRELPFPTG